MIDQNLNSNILKLEVGSGQISDYRPTIPDGHYISAYRHYATVNYQGQPKVVVCFAILEGPHEKTLLERWYNVKRLIGPPKQAGNYEAKFVSDLHREFVAVAGRVPARLDRISYFSFRDLPIEITTRTVKRDNRGVVLPVGLQYSVISQVIGVKDGSC